MLLELRAKFITLNCSSGRIKIGQHRAVQLGESDSVLQGLAIVYEDLVQMYGSQAFISEKLMCMRWAGQRNIMIENLCVRYTKVFEALVDREIVTLDWLTELL